MTGSRRISILIMSGAAALGALWGALAAINRLLATRSPGVLDILQLGDAIEVGLSMLVYGAIGCLLGALPALTYVAIALRESVEESRRRTRASLAAHTEAIAIQRRDASKAAGCAAGGRPR